MPMARAFSATAAPTAFAASVLVMSATFAAIDFSRVDAEHSVTPFTSSMICA